MADPSMNVTFRKPFAEQLAAFRLKLNNLVPTSRWDDVWKEQHDRAGIVAGATKAELIGDILGAVYKSMEEGTTFDQFRKDFPEIVKRHGWHGWTGEGSAKGQAWRMRVIYKTNMRTSYMAGRWAQLQRPVFKFWIYRHGGSVEPRLRHLAWDGLVLERGHPFWSTHFPPNGWGCSCEVAGAMSRKDAARRGGDLSKSLPDNWQAPDPRTGEPKGIGKGWGYAPGASVADTVQVGAQLLAKLPPRIGADYGASFSDMIENAWPMWLADVRAGGAHEKALIGVVSPNVQQALKAEGRALEGAEIMMRPGLIKGPKVERHEAKGDALSLDDLADLPRQFRNPTAVLLDRRTGAVLYILGDGSDQAQLAVKLNFRTKEGTRNEVVSAYRPVMGQVRARIAAGVLQVIAGSL